jgi:ferritin-like metal-binding protein YciE
MSVESLQELFLDELKDLYSAEKQITGALPKLVKAAEMLKKKGTGKTCEGMKSRFGQFAAS